VTAPRDPRLLVVALGGRALAGPGEAAAPADWFRGLGRSLPPLVDLVAAGFRLVLTHGAGPQVEDELLRMELARRAVPALTLDLCGAGVQGSLGYAIQQVLGNLCHARGVDVVVAAIVTRVLVDADDPAFAAPSAPVGPSYPAAQARRLERELGWRLVEDGARGHRRVVPAPRPRRVLEADVVRRLADAGVVPVAAGGGGVAVVRTAVGYEGVEAVIEKDLTAAALATAVGADRILFLTGVSRAAVGHGTPRAIEIERLTAAEARALLSAGEFPPGSMGVKVEAALEFLAAGGREALITSLADVRAALAGRAGTRVVA
jgi:carbamate kinase